MTKHRHLEMWKFHVFSILYHTPNYEKVADSWFSTKNGHYLEEYIKELSITFENTELSETPKVYVRMEHFTHCLDYLNEEGVGIC